MGERLEATRARRPTGLRIVVAVAAMLLLACGGPSAGTVRVVIPPGSSFRVAADSLAHAGVVSSSRLFRIYASLGGHDRRIRAGTYLMGRGMSWRSVVEALTDGTGLLHTVTIPEGYAIADIAPLLARSLGVQVESVEVAATDSALRRRLDVPTATLEGYLFPDTYAFPDGTTGRAAVETMVRRFEQIWEPQWNDRLQALAISRHDALTLASIVEKEARLAPERPVIAAVYLNRLRAGMRLQADPTVQYAHGGHVARLLYKDLEIDSPYNTYKYAGLPPGPIASPGRASIVAALNPASVRYRFFVAHPDGHHEFNVEYSAHSRAVAAIRRERDAGGGAPSISPAPVPKKPTRIRGRS